MTATQNRSRQHVERPAPSRLVDVVDTILDRGLVLDLYARGALSGVEVVYADGRMVTASMNSYLRIARAVERLEMSGEASGPVLLMH